MNRLSLPPFALPTVLKFSALAGILLLSVNFGCTPDQKARAGEEKKPVPVDVAPVEKGAISLIRNLSGTLRANSDFTVAPKVSSRVTELRVRDSDPVEQGAVVAVLDNEPFEQQVRQAEADLLVAKANLAEAKAQLEIANRGMDRVRQLSERGFASDTEYDAALTDQLAAEASQEVAKAHIARAEAALTTARIQLGYTQVRAEWSGGERTRVVAERFVDVGDTVSVNQPIFRIVDLDPLLAVVNVTEGDYPKVHVGNPVTVQTDAFPKRVFDGKVVRIAPIFSEMSRQASVEFQVPNPDKILKPGMFIQAALMLERKTETTVVPTAALVRRQDHDGLFVVDPDGRRVSWHPVETGIQEGDRTEIVSPEISGLVVILGQQLLEDGSVISTGGTANGEEK